MWLSFHLPLCFAQEHKLAWPDRKKPLSHMRHVWIRTVFAEENMSTFLVFCFRGEVCVVCFPHRWMGSHKCQVLIMWSVRRTLEPWEEIQESEVSVSKLFAELALKGQKGFEECQFEHFSLWYAVRAFVQACLINSLSPLSLKYVQDSVFNYNFH